MGSAYSYISPQKHWYVYTRRLDTDSYETMPLLTWKNISLETALGRFKHEMYAFSLSHYTYGNNTKAVYLYYGSTRIMKISIINNQVVAESSERLCDFLTSTEECSPGRYPKLQTQFEHKWFHNHARLNVHSVCWVLNESKSYAKAVKSKR